NFMRPGDDAVERGLGGKAGDLGDTLRGYGSARLPIRGLQLREHRDRKNTGAAKTLGPANARDLGPRAGHHLGRAAARAVGVDVEHLHAEPRRLDGGAQHFLRAVIEFEVEKNLGAAPPNLANEIRAAADE